MILEQHTCDLHVDLRGECRDELGRSSSIILKSSTYQARGTERNLWIIITRWNLQESDVHSIAMRRHNTTLRKLSSSALKTRCQSCTFTFQARRFVVFIWAGERENGVYQRFIRFFTLKMVNIFTLTNYFDFAMITFFENLCLTSNWIQTKWSWYF